MRANRKFVWDEEAVSPVIAVILMVAITVVLAATVFVLVSDIGKQTGSATPTFQFTKDEPNDQITVTSRTEGANWNRVQFGGSDKTFSFRFAGTTNAVAIDAWGAASTASDPIEGGDKVTFCRPDGASNIAVTIRDLQTQTVINTVSFDSVDTSCT